MAATVSFTEFPIDVQLNILSFLTPTETSAFSCTSRHSSDLSSSPTLIHSMLHRRWGHVTTPRLWSPHSHPLRVYRALSHWERLIGFWRRIGHGAPDSPPLLFFQWGPSYITGSRVSPSTDHLSYAVTKIPFLFIGLSSDGDPVSYLHPGPGFDGDNFISSSGELVPVNVSFMGDSHFVVEESKGFAEEEDVGAAGTSPPEEIYRYFANRTSPGGERRQRRKERERMGRRRLWESEHFVKIENYKPTPSRPLQGLWKGLCEERNLEFYLVAYDDIGGITCRRVGDTAEPFSGYSPVFWTSNTTFLKPPFSPDEEEMYIVREHIEPLAAYGGKRDVVSRILCINSSYDLVLPDLSGSAGAPRNVEGRIWEYEDMTFGFGFLRNNLIIDMKHVTLDGHLLDAVEVSSQASC